MKNIFTTYIICFLCLFIACQSHMKESEPEESSAISNTPEMAQLNELLKKNPEEINLWFQRGSLYYDMQRYPEAIRDLQKVLQMDSSDVEARHLLADAYLDNLQSREALAMMEATTQMFPERIASLLKLSEFQLILKRYSEAINTLNRIQQIDPQNADAYFMKGMVLKENGHHSGYRSISVGNQRKSTFDRCLDQSRSASGSQQ